MVPVYFGGMGFLTFMQEGSYFLPSQAGSSLLLPLQNVPGQVSFVDLLFDKLIAFSVSHATISNSPF